MPQFIYALLLRYLLYIYTFSIAHLILCHISLVKPFASFRKQFKACFLYAMIYLQFHQVDISHIWQSANGTIWWVIANACVCMHLCACVRVRTRVNVRMGARMRDADPSGSTFLLTQYPPENSSKTYKRWAECQMETNPFRSKRNLSHLKTRLGTIRSAQRHPIAKTHIIK